MFEEMLPIGTVVLLKDAVKKLMITGYKQISSKDKSKIYDYIGVIYPAGSLGSITQIPFDHDNIQDVIFKGYHNSEYNDMVAALEEKAQNDPAFADAIRSKSINPTSAT